MLYRQIDINIDRMKQYNSFIISSIEILLREEPKLDIACITPRLLVQCLNNIIDIWLNFIFASFIGIIIFWKKGICDGHSFNSPSNYVKIYFAGNPFLIYFWETRYAPIQLKPIDSNVILIQPIGCPLQIL